MNDYISVSDLQKDIKKDALEKCKIFYSSVNKVTWDVDNGWYDILYDFSVKCEELNLRFYKKYGTKVIASQIKQKFGKLEIYCNFVQAPPKILRFFSKILHLISKFFVKIDFGYKCITTKPAYRKNIIRIYKDEEEREKNIFNILGEKIYDWDGKFIKISHYNYPGTTKLIPTKNKLKHCVLYFLINTIKKIENHRKNPPNVNKVVLNYIEITTNQYIKEAKELASRTCEKCGLVHNDKKDLCKMSGWISFLCERCACETNRNYERDGKIFKNGEFIKESGW